MLFLCLEESHVDGFDFIFNDQMQSGMRHNNTLYGLAYSFDKGSQMDAYHFAQTLSSFESGIIVTTSAIAYNVWITLDSSYLNLDCELFSVRHHKLQDSILVS